MPRTGRPKAPIDLVELEGLAKLHATDQEIADWFKIDVATVERRRKNSREFREAYSRGRADGKLNLRRKQIAAAETGNPALLIWLGKQWLGQRDVQAMEFLNPVEHAGKIKIVIEHADVQGNIPEAPQSAAAGDA